MKHLSLTKKEKPYTLTVNNGEDLIVTATDMDFDTITVTNGRLLLYAFKNTVINKLNVIGSSSVEIHLVNGEIKDFGVLNGSVLTVVSSNNSRCFGTVFNSGHLIVRSCNDSQHEITFMDDTYGQLSSTDNTTIDLHLYDNCKIFTDETESCETYIHTYSPTVELKETYK